LATPKSKIFQRSMPLSSRMNPKPLSIKRRAIVPVGIPIPPLNVTAGTIPEARQAERMRWGPEEAARRCAEEFTARLGGLDVVLMGVGPDGHIASLFPGHAALQATGVCVAVPDSPKPPPQRLASDFRSLSRSFHRRPATRPRLAASR